MIAWSNPCPGAVPGGANGTAVLFPDYFTQQKALWRFGVLNINFGQQLLSRCLVAGPASPKVIVFFHRFQDLPGTGHTCRKGYQIASA